MDLPDDRAEAPRTTDLEGKEHGLALACYRKNQPGPAIPAPATHEVLPTLECVCGMWWAGDTWEDAGSYFDDHLEDVKDGPA